MSDSATAHGLRPLPARPNLEFERKRAKKLAAELRARDPNAKLADAQFAIAREYGFASWPRLVTYFETLSRHERSAPPPAWYRGDQLDRVVESVLLQHRQGNLWRAQMIATFVHNLLVAFFRTELPLPLDALGTADDSDDGFDRLVRSIAHRIVPRDVSVIPPDVPFSTSAKAALDAARTEAERRNREQVHSFHLLFALAANAGPFAEFVRPFAGTLDKLRDLCASAL